MSICDFCNEDMADLQTVTCMLTQVRFIEGDTLPRIPYTPEDGRKCHDCFVAAGAFHHPGCDMDLCPICGGQIISCGCQGGPDWDVTPFEEEPEEDNFFSSLLLQSTDGPPLRILYEKSPEEVFTLKEGETFSGKWTEQNMWEEYNRVMPMMASRGLSPISAWFTVAQTIAQDYEALAARLEALIAHLKEAQ